MEPVCPALDGGRHRARKCVCAWPTLMYIFIRHQPIVFIRTELLDPSPHPTYILRSTKKSMTGPSKNLLSDNAAVLLEQTRPPYLFYSIPNLGKSRIMSTLVHPWHKRVFAAIPHQLQNHSKQLNYGSHASYAPLDARRIYLVTRV